MESVDRGPMSHRTAPFKYLKRNAHVAELLCPKKASKAAIMRDEIDAMLLVSDLCGHSFVCESCAENSQLNVLVERLAVVWRTPSCPG